MTVLLSEVLTVDDVRDEVGGADTLDNLQCDPKKVQDAMQRTLTDVLEALRNRVPPIVEGDIGTPSELRLTVLYGTCERLYLQNITTGDGKDIASVKHRHYSQRYLQHRRDLRPTIASSGEKAGSNMSIALHRR